MRTAIYIGTGCSLIALTAFSFTPLSSNVASVIGAGDQLTNACQRVLQDENPNATIEMGDVRKVDLNDDGANDRILTLTGKGACGTNGCVHEICLARGSNVDRIPFGYAATELSVLGTKQSGMYDIRINDSVTLSWDGERYSLTE